jgi:Protease inhibitor Inh
VRNIHWAHGWRGLVLVGGLLTGGQAAASSPQVQDLAGVWDLSIEGTNTKCRIALRAGQSGAGRQLITIPLACLKSFPGLAPVDGWALTGDGDLDLFDSTDQTVLDFTATDDAKAFIASGPQGGVYRLAAMQATPPKKEPLFKQGGTGPTPEAAATKQDVAATTVSGAAGRYSILRDGGKDTGCMLTLDNQLKAPGGKKASLAPGCRDQGIVIFDPAGWQIINGRLVLTARKGHKTDLDAQPDGTWKKDPKEGKSLTLKKL